MYLGTLVQRDSICGELLHNPEVANQFPQLGNKLLGCAHLGLVNGHPVSLSTDHGDVVIPSQLKIIGGHHSEGNFRHWQGLRRNGQLAEGDNLACITFLAAPVIPG